jgi:hypothetical protein
MTEPNMTAADQPADSERVLADALASDAEKTLADTAKKIEVLPPGVRLASNLDTYENQYFRMIDPEEVDFQDIIIGQENPRLMLHVLMDPDQRDTFFSLRMPMGKMKKLITDYTRHFGLTDLGELAGSAPSSNGTQGR